MRLLYILYFVKTTDYKRLWEYAKHAHEQGYAYFYLFVSMIYCSFRFKSAFDEFFIFRFYSKTNQERSLWACSGYMYEYQRKMNPVGCREILDDKTLFYKHYGDLMIHGVGDICDLENKSGLLEKIYNNKAGKLVFKTKNGQCGNSVYVCNANDIPINGVISFMKKQKWDLLEEYVIQHKDITKLSPFAVNTIRIVTQINKNGGVDILACRMRISGGANVDNFSHKSHTGMAAAIDLETGAIKRPAVLKDNYSEPIYVHPKTGVSIVGFHIPYWDKVISLAIDAALKEPQNKSIGWDIVVTESGPGLIEGNHNWNRDIYQMPVNMGLKPVLDEYLKGER